MGGLMVLKFSQQDLIPFDITRMALKIQEWSSDDGELMQHASEMNCSLDAHIGSLISAADKMNSASMIFDAYYEETLEIINGNATDADDFIEDVKKINGILVEFNKKMVLKYPQGLPSNKWWKQLLFAPGKKFPFIWDVVEECDNSELENAFLITVGAI